jgi:DNA-binding transcriptional MerR regulator
MSGTKPSSTTHYGIGTVARLTGLTDHTIRVWERRYGAVDPVRSDAGRRRYTAAHVERLGLLKRLVDLGESIGTIAGLDDETLRERLRALLAQADDLRDSGQPLSLRLAALTTAGDSHARRLAASFPGIRVLVDTPHRELFRAEVAKMRPNALMLDYPALTEDVLSEIRHLREAAPSARCVVLYGFGRRPDIERLEQDGISMVQAPSDLADLVRALTVAVPSAREPEPGAPVPDLGTDNVPAPEAFEIARRQFNIDDLLRLAEASPVIECECPRHLISLIRSLTAFEIYSANCESRSPQDAALHQYLHAQTSQARATIEGALTRLMEIEGIDLDAMR